MLTPSEQVRRQELARSELQMAQLVEMSEPDKALIHLQRAEQMDAANPAILILIGRTQMRLGLVVDAVNTLERLLQLSPGHQEAISSLAYGQVELGNYDIAADRAKQALALNPSNYMAREVLADCYYAASDHKACLRELNQLTVVYQDEALARVTKKAAYCLHELGHYKMALTATSTLIENDYDKVFPEILEVYNSAQEHVRAEIHEKYPNMNFLQKLANKINDSFLLRMHLDSTRGMETLQIKYDEATKELEESAQVIEDHEHRADELTRKANTDQLTGLPNRHCFNDIWLPKIEAAAQCAVVALDLDHFKLINSVHEHAGGDKALAKAAEIGGRTFRHPDGNLFRFGGEEFYGIVLENRTRALEMAEEFRAAIEKDAVEELAEEGLALQWPDNPLYEDKLKWPGNGAQLEPRVLTASIGIAFWPQDGSSVEDVMKAADKACYAAKNGGRNQVAIYVPGMVGGDESKADSAALAGLPSADQAREANAKAARDGQVAALLATPPVKEPPSKDALLSKPRGPRPPRTTRSSNATPGAGTL